MVAPRALLNLARAGFTDRRETFSELAKRVACLRQHNMAATDILVHTNMDAGHGGASGRFESLIEVAKEYAFALKLAGLLARDPATS